MQQDLSLGSIWQNPNLHHSVKQLMLQDVYNFWRKATPTDSEYIDSESELPFCLQLRGFKGKCSISPAWSDSYTNLRAALLCTKDHCSN